MKILKKILIFIGILLSLHIFLCIAFYFFQEKVLFHPTKLESSFNYNFQHDFEELNIKMDDGTELNSLLFKAEESKGLIFFLHGNAGALNSWGSLAQDYLKMNYDFFVVDYRGFGKSGGVIESKEQLLCDVQVCYNRIKEQYVESEIIIVGFSIATGPAAYLASNNSPSKLILLAPYYSIDNLVKGYCPIVPGILIKYDLNTYEYIKNCKVPIAIFHGDDDKVIPVSNSQQLNTFLKNSDKYFILKNESHNSIVKSATYFDDLKTLISQ